ncbi:MAG: hypothetical protein RLZZ428_517, partial [Pseudomonadota bacterium]
MHGKLENFMGKMGEFIFDNPLKVIVVVLMLLAFPLSHVPQIKMDTSTEGFMHDEDPVLLQYNQFRGQFGRDERVIIALQSDDIFTLKFLTMLRSLHEELAQNVPFLEDITSLYNVRNTRGEGDKLITDDLLEPFPTTQAQVDEIKKRAMDSEFYRDLLLSQDGKMTTIVIETDAYSHEGEKAVSDIDAFEEGFNDTPTQKNIEATKQRPFLTDKENAELVAAVQDIVKKYEQNGVKIFISGSPSVNHALKSQ